MEEEEGEGDDEKEGEGDDEKEEGGARRKNTLINHTAIYSLDPCSAVTLDPRSLNIQQLHWIHAHSTSSSYTGSTLTQHPAVTLDPRSLNTRPLYWIHTHSTSSSYTESMLT